MKIGISILDAKKEALSELNKLDNEYLHLDIMDGIFVTKKTAEFDKIKEYTSYFNKKIDIHFMVENVNKYIQEYQSLNPEYMTFHIETKQDINYLINCIKKNGIKVGLAIKPTTPIETLKPFLNQIDLVLLMSVEPGLGGQEFLKTTINRIKQLENIKKQNNWSFKIEVDGGINPQTIKYVKEADMLVVGSYITKSDNYLKSLKEIQEAIYDCNN